MSKIGHSKTTDNLIKEIDRFKESKNEYVNKLTA